MLDKNNDMFNIELSIHHMLAYSINHSNLLELHYREYFKILDDNDPRLIEIKNIISKAKEIENNKKELMEYTSTSIRKLL